MEDLRILPEAREATVFSLLRSDHRESGYSVCCLRSVNA